MKSEAYERQTSDLFCFCGSLMEAGVEPQGRRDSLFRLNECWEMEPGGVLLYGAVRQVHTPALRVKVPVEVELADSRSARTV